MRGDGLGSAENIDTVNNLKSLQSVDSKEGPNSFWRRQRPLWSGLFLFTICQLKRRPWLLLKKTKTSMIWSLPIFWGLLLPRAFLFSWTCPSAPSCYPWTILCSFPPQGLCTCWPQLLSHQTPSFSAPFIHFSTQLSEKVSLTVKSKTICFFLSHKNDRGTFAALAAAWSPVHWGTQETW